MGKIEGNFEEGRREWAESALIAGKWGFVGGSWTRTFGYEQVRGCKTSKFEVF
jgi:hypothetical protein